MGNIRVSYFKNTNGSAEVLEENNFYPFGMKHEGYNQTTGNPAYSYQYNGKELQTERGWSDYGARMYMSDIARWGVTDPLAETSRRWSPYAYAYNNPVMFLDPDGMQNVSAVYWEFDPNTTLTGGDYFAGSTLGAANFSNQMSLWQDAAGGGGSGPTPKSGTGIQLGQILSNFFARLFGTAKRDAKISTVLPGAVITRVSPVQVGTLEGSFETALNWEEVAAVLGTISRAGQFAIPLMLNGDSSHARGYDIPLTGATDVPADEPEQMITLYRGVSSRIFHNDNSQYLNAHLGIAIPKGYNQVSTLFGPHSDMSAHADGDNYSIWTSWSSDKEVARDFATGIAFGKAVPGIIMSKTFRVGQAVPNPFTLGESEWLVPGVVYGAKVQYVLPRPGQ
ncbi:RHS repeat domain-containing protein [Chryseobacterium mucoviscidosis]|uniref:RHS repeat domain-containing protein n=1 Tax=Chryseobacterium mucoviscidosis TaxID=1945581 RepID=UPI003AFA997F